MDEEYKDEDEETFTKVMVKERSVIIYPTVMYQF